MKKAARVKVFKAGQKLRLLNIELCAAKFERHAPLPKQDQQVIQQHKRGVGYLTGEAISEEGETLQVLEVRIQLGIRVLDESASKPTVFFEIEAHFVAAYALTEAIDGDSLKAFAEINAVHNVWPFWRQHVYDIVQRAQLPHLDIPLLVGQKQ